MTCWLTIIGIGEDGLDGLGRNAREVLDNARVLVGGRRHLAMVPERDGVERLLWASPFSASFEELDRRRGTPVCLLTSNDPMMYGAAATLSRRYPAHEMRVLPIASSYSLAAARLGWALQDVERLSVHGRPLATLNRWFTEGTRLLILSENAQTPGHVARLLCERGFPRSRLTVLEHLEGERENRFDGLADSWDHPPGADLNVLAVEVCSGAMGTVPVQGLTLLAGLPDDAFAHDGQLTKRDVRAIVLSRLSPRPGELLWDVGAGSGSIAIEWMRAHPRCRAIAVERAAKRLAYIDTNRQRLGVPGLDIVEGLAPAALSGLPTPDAVFVGGGLTEDLVPETCWTHLKPGGRFVATAVTLQTEKRLLDLRDAWGGTLTRISLASDGSLGGFDTWRPALPITLFAVHKPG